MVGHRVGTSMAQQAITARRPDFFIVGHAKSGTTALHQMLGEHPQIFLPDLKEPNFLAADLAPRFQKPRSPRLPTTLAEYLDLFAGARPQQRVGEASVVYLRSRTAAQAIAALNPEARIIAILREPASFLRSVHLQLFQARNESVRSLRQALELEPERRLGRRIPRHCAWPDLLLYSEYIRYLDQIRRYHAAFPRDQVMVAIYEDFRRDNQAMVRGVLRFVGVDDLVPVTSIEVNPTVHVRSQALEDALHRISVGRDPLSRGLKAGIKAITPLAARRRLMGAVRGVIVSTSPPPPDEGLMAELRSKLKPEVEALSDYLAMDLVRTWGYDDV